MNPTIHNAVNLSFATLAFSTTVLVWVVIYGFWKTRNDLWK